MQNRSSLCEQFSQILGGKPNVERNICSVEKDRSHIDVRILGRRSQSGLALHSMWSFESIDYQGRALNLGETALLQEEVYPFISHLQKSGIILTALHNHWLFDQPHLIYAHYASIENPLSFAKKVAQAYKILKQN